MNKGIFALIVLIVTGCTSVKSGKSIKKENSNESLKVELTGFDGSEIKNPKGKIRLYALPANLADVPATLIAEKEFSQNKVPFIVEITLPENHRKMIKPALKDGESVNYYVALDWDSDGNGKVEKGDIVIDFNKKFPTVFLNSDTQKVFVKK